jgi:glycosyltransferase involved in cell wall biosynthesis
MGFMPDQAEFVLLSFEGPDLYSQAGGLGVRVTNLARCLAARGFCTHLFFIGDPNLPGYEEQYGGCLRLHRWCQWISQYHLMGVYDGEQEKLADFQKSAPTYIVEQIARPTIEGGKHLVVLAEEWQTAEALISLSDLLHQADLRDRSILIWNANNTKGFERIDWKRLDYVATLTTVSRYMKQAMRTHGIDPLVIPNGIPSDLFQPVPEEAVKRVRQCLAQGQDTILLKVARFDPDKCWWSAVEAVKLLKQSRIPVRLLCRGGIEEYGKQVLSHAYELGLTIKDVEGQYQTWEEALEAIQSVGAADIYNLRFNLSQPMLRILYAAADFILANSKHEPFGLVGLEAMAVGGVVITGSTGEAYSTDGTGAVALDTEDASELVMTIETLKNSPERLREIRQTAPYVASRYIWENVVEILVEKIYLARERQLVQPFKPSQMAAPGLAREHRAEVKEYLPEKIHLTAWYLASRLRMLENAANPLAG